MAGVGGPAMDEASFEAHGKRGGGREKNLLSTFSSSPLVAFIYDVSTCW